MCHTLIRLDTKYKSTKTFYIHCTCVLLVQSLVLIQHDFSHWPQGLQKCKEAQQFSPILNELVLSQPVLPKGRVGVTPSNIWPKGDPRSLFCELPMDRRMQFLSTLMRVCYGKCVMSPVAVLIYELSEGGAMSSSIPNQKCRAGLVPLPPFIVLFYNVKL